MTTPQGTDLTADLDWLFARQRFGVHPGLDRVRALLASLGQPQQRFRVVLVGGTNGKGSTAATLASILRAAGEQVSLFTSPHLTHFAERFCVNGQPLPDPVVAQALSRVRPKAEATGASFFEIVTALGCLLFAEAGVETAVMEVGLGGRLDATNALDPVLSIITSVGLDHTDILGSTLEAIAQEKAGILRPGRPAVTAVSPALRPLLEAVGADLWAMPDIQVDPQGWMGSHVTLPLPAVSAGPVVPASTVGFWTPLLGQHGAANAALAALAAFRLGVSAGAIQQGTAQTIWPGRMEVLPWAGGQVLLDGAHNPDGARALAGAMQALGVGRIPVVFGAAADKDLLGVAAALRPLASEVILTRALLSPRAAAPETLAPLFPEHAIHLTQTPQQALEWLRTRGVPLAVVCGSLYLIGELRPLLLGQTSEPHERWQ